MEKRIEIYYRDVDPKITLYLGLIGIALFAIPVSNDPDCWWLVLILFKEFRISDPIHPECLLVPQYT